MSTMSINDKRTKSYNIEIIVIEKVMGIVPFVATQLKGDSSYFSQ